LIYPLAVSNSRGKAMPWLRQLVAGLSMKMPRSVHVRFVVDKVALGQVFLSEFFSFPVSIIPSWHSTLIYHLGDKQQACRWHSSEKHSLTPPTWITITQDERQLLA
jgi:hypothetical protein